MVMKTTCERRESWDGKVRLYDSGLSSPLNASESGYDLNRYPEASCTL